MKTTTEQDDAARWRAEIAGWPPALRAVAEHFPPGVRVRIIATGAIGVPHGFSEDVAGAVTVEVIVRQRWNPHLFMPQDQLVFGLAPGALETIQ